jgi:hypothetical protein
MYRQRRIREALRARPAALTPAAFALGCAVWQVKPGPQSHEECLVGMPRLLEAEWSGRGDSSGFLIIRRHLLICPSCARIYLDLIELAEDEEDELSRPPQIPPPDLSFLDAEL